MEPGIQTFIVFLCLCFQSSCLYRVKDTDSMQPVGTCQFTVDMPLKAISLINTYCRKFNSTKRDNEHLFKSDKNKGVTVKIREILCEYAT